MAHASDRTLIQALGIEADRKTQDHDLVCLYLQANAQRLAEKYRLPRKRSYQVTATDECNYIASDVRQRLNELRICRHCQFFFAGDRDWKQRRRSNQEIIDVNAHISRVVDVKTTLERVITKGSREYQSHIGFIDLQITSHAIRRHHYAETPLHFNRECDGSYYGPEPSNPGTTTEPHSARVGLLFAERTLEDKDSSEFVINVEVKTRTVPLGDLIRQIKLYQLYEVGHIWVVATTVALSASYCDALHNENIQTLLIGDEYKQADAPAQMEMF